MLAVTGESLHSLRSQQPAATNYSLKDLLQTDGYSGANTTDNNEICLWDLR